MSGAGALSSYGAEGPTWLVAAPVVVHQGATVTVVTRFRLPGTHGSMAVVPSARIPGEQWTYQGTPVHVDRTVTVHW
jgi:hypothetical protein